MGVCTVCDKSSELVSGSLGLCARCIRENFQAAEARVRQVHMNTRRPYGLPGAPPKSGIGLECDLCQNRCRMMEGMLGFCGIRRNEGGRIKGGRAFEGNLSFYYDPLPTNCTGDWVCAEGSASDRREPGKNLAVFYHACPFNCLFCQNHEFKTRTFSTTRVPARDLAAAVDRHTACICYFGGDPAPQVLHALATSRQAVKRAKKEWGRELRICWETSGSFGDRYMGPIAELSLASGGLIKFDLKAFDEKIHIALTGVSNRQTLKNFAKAAEYARKRPESPLVMASTLMVPGYVDVDEVKKIARFIADLNPDIPYSLLGFHPQFHMRDMPLNTKKTAFEAKACAEEEGLRRVRIGNLHLFV